MLRKLRRKFILINMLLVSTVLLIVFAAIFISTYQRQQAMSENILRMELERTPTQKPPKWDVTGGDHPRNDFVADPAFWVLVSADGEVLSVSQDRYTVSDELAAQAAEAALDSGVGSGTISSLRLRFLRQDTEEGVKIAFTDISRERQEIANLLFTSLLVGAGGLIAFFFISLFLAKWALRPVEQAWKQQRQFVADASHELKTPLTVILANMNILTAHPASTVGEQGKWVSHTQDEANRMKKLVDDLLFLAKSDDARTAMLTEFSLSDAAWSSVLPFESVAFESGVSLDSEIAPELSMVGDESKIRQLVIILLDNACKYAGAGGNVRLSLSPDGGSARLTVHNTGAPIPKEHLEHLFERFYRVEYSRSRGVEGPSSGAATDSVNEPGGYGLGLAIAKSIVDEHRGRISVSSGEEEGTTFTVVLPPSSHSARKEKFGNRRRL